MTDPDRRPPLSATNSHRWPIVAIIAAAAVVAVAGAGAVAYAGRAKSPAAVAETPAGFPEAAPDPPGALDELDRVSAQDLAGLSLDGQYVAQLASKTPGISDPLQLAADGTHTFQASDILQEHRGLRGNPDYGDAQIVLLKSTDYGQRQLYNGERLYVTLALADFRGKNDVLLWCTSHFPGLSGDALLNVCTARRLMAPA